MPDNTKKEECHCAKGKGDFECVVSTANCVIHKGNTTTDKNKEDFYSKSPVPTKEELDQENKEEVCLTCKGKAPSSNEDRIEAEVDYIIFNLLQAIKHEIEGTNIGEYKYDVAKYTKELKDFIRQQRIQAQRELARDFVEMIDNEIRAQMSKDDCKDMAMNLKTILIIRGLLSNNKE